jgi:hypothetical protein
LEKDSKIPNRWASQLWIGGSVRDAMPGEEGGAVKLMCQECGKV